MNPTLPPGRIITSIAGNGAAEFSGDGGPTTGASLNHATGVAVDASGNLFIADNFNSRVRRVDAVTGIITTAAATALKALAAMAAWPSMQP